MEGSTLFSPKPEVSREGLLRYFSEYFIVRKRVPLKNLMDSVERSILIKILDRVNGNQRKAAKILGVKCTTLNQKIRKYNIHFRSQSYIID